jgi:hypothetical protein
VTNELQTARYDNLLRRAGGLLGPGSKVTETLSELFPVFETENLPAELLFLGGWLTGMNTTIVAATVGQTSRAQVFNPAGSGKIAVVTDIHITSAGAAMFVDWQINETPFPVIVTGITRDTHAGFAVGTALATGPLSTGNTPTAGRLTVPANATFHFHVDNGIAVLAPGSGLEIGTSADNLALNVTWFWRERIALDSELNFP